MAKVVEKYLAEARGGSTMYYYRYPDWESAATRIYSGESFFLHRDYISRESEGMYLMVEPSGWIPFYYAEVIEPYYITITDPCTPPASVTLDAVNRRLIISGGAGGDLNQLTGYGISCRDRALNSTVWGEWSEDTVVAETEISVSVESGMVRQYRARTLGSAGSSYYSAYTVCETLFNGNTAAGTPAVLLPVSGLETCSALVVMMVDCPPEPDGDAMVLQRSVDGGTWTDAAQLGAEGGLISDPLSFEQGAHTVRYRLMDSQGQVGGSDGCSFTRTPLSWHRVIQQGEIIANQEISFVADILEMHRYVNMLRAFYGKTQITLPGTPGLLADWYKQMIAMQNAIDGCRKATGREAYGFQLPTGWPKGYRIQQLREAIENT